MKARALWAVCMAGMFLAGCKRKEIEVVDYADPPPPPEQLAAQWTAEAFASLSGRLMEAITTDGHDAAIHVCAMEASDLLDGVAEAHGVSIRRVTDRPRNPSNLADERDLEVMEMMRRMLTFGEQPTPVVDENVVRLPIRIPMPLCITCHGDPNTDIPPETWKAIGERYPQDAAIGYREGDLRGLWRVEFSISSK